MQELEVMLNVCAKTICSYTSTLSTPWTLCRCLRCKPRLACWYHLPFLRFFLVFSCRTAVDFDGWSLCSDLFLLHLIEKRFLMERQTNDSILHGLGYFTNRLCCSERFGLQEEDGVELSEYERLPSARSLILSRRISLSGMTVYNFW